MRQLTYISTSRGSGKRSLLAEIEAQSQRRNALVGITGMLLFDGVRFLQVLEGDAAALDETYARIKADPRHYALVKLRDIDIETPHFPGWAMLARDVVNQRDRLTELLQPYLLSADRSTKALFTSFVELRDKAA